MNSNQAMLGGPSNPGRAPGSAGTKGYGRFHLADVPRMFWVRMAVFGLLCAVVGGTVGWLVSGRDDMAGAASTQPPGQTPVPPTDPSNRQTAAALIQFHEDFCETDFDAFRATQEQLLRSRSVLGDALTETGEAAREIDHEESDPVEWLAEHLQTDFPGPGVMRIRLELEDPPTAARLTNTVSRVFLDYYTKHRRATIEAQIADLRRQSNEQQQLVQHKQHQLAALVKRFKVDDLDKLAAAQRGALGRVSQLEEQLEQVRAEHAAVVEQLYEQERLLDQDVEDLEVTDAELELFAQSDPVANGLQQQVAEIEERLAFAEVSVNPGAVARWVERYQNQLRATRERLASRRDEIRPLAQQEKHLAAQSAVVDLRSQIEPLAQQERRLGEQLARLQGDAEKIGARSANVDTMRAEILEAQTTLARLEQRQGELKAEHDSGQWATLLQTAVVPYPTP